MLCLIVWLIPVLGFFIANHLGNLQWFKVDKSDTGSSAISAGFLEADSVFNPGAKNTIEIVDKQDQQVQESMQYNDEHK